MFGNFKTIRLAISVIVILQFGFLMPLAPVLAQEAKAGEFTEQAEDLGQWKEPTELIVEKAVLPDVFENPVVRENPPIENESIVEEEVLVREPLEVNDESLGQGDDVVEVDIGLPEENEIVVETQEVINNNGNQEDLSVEILEPENKVEKKINYSSLMRRVKDVRMGQGEDKRASVLEDFDNFISQEKNRLSDLSVDFYKQKSYLKRLRGQLKGLDNTEQTLVQRILDKIVTLFGFGVDELGFDEEQVVDETEFKMPDNPAEFGFNQDVPDLKKINNITVPANQKIDNLIKAFITIEDVQAESVLPTIDDLQSDDGEIIINSTIRDLANDLNNNPVEINNFIRENINYEVYYGAKKGNLGCLEELSCNDVDTASLTISLMRAAGIPAHYKKSIMVVSIEELQDLLGIEKTIEGRRTVYGIFGWNKIPIYTITDNPTVGENLDTGDFTNETHFALEWVFPEIYYDYDERGANIHNLNDLSTASTTEELHSLLAEEYKKQWMPVDVIFKNYDYTQKQIVADIANFNTESFWYNFLQYQGDLSPLEKYTQDLLNATGKDINNQTYQSINSSITKNYEILSPTLPYVLGEGVDSEGNEILPETWSALPDDRKTQVKIQLKNADTNEVVLEHTFFGNEINNKELNLYYEGVTDSDQQIIDSYGGLHATPAELVDIKAYFSGDYERYDGTGSFSIGDSMVLRFEYYQKGVLEYDDEKFSTAGNQEGIYVVLSKVQVDPYLDTNSKILLRGNVGLAREYLRQVQESADLFEKSLDYNYNVNFARAVVTQNRILNTINNVPTTFDFKGLTIDAGTYINDWSNRGNYKNHKKDFRLLFGLESSYYEGQIFDNVAGLEGISTVTGLQYAYAHPADYTVYTIKSDNESVIDTLNLSDNTKANMHADVQKGNTIVTPNKFVTAGNWNGIFYISLDPVWTGTYAIGEQTGENGGWTVNEYTLEDWDDEDNDHNFAYQYDNGPEKYIYKEDSERNIQCTIKTVTYNQIVGGDIYPGWKIYIHGKPCMDDNEDGPYWFGNYDHRLIVATDGIFVSSTNLGYSYWESNDSIVSKYYSNYPDKDIGIRDLHVFYGTYAYKQESKYLKSFESLLMYSPLNKEVYEIRDSLGKKYISNKLILETFTPFLIGYPTSNSWAVSTFVIGGIFEDTILYDYAQNFINGRMYEINKYESGPFYNAAVPTVYQYVVPGGISTVHLSNGGLDDLGFPSSDPAWFSAGDNVIYQHFTDGSIITYDLDSGVSEVIDKSKQVEILQNYQEEKRDDMVEGILDSFSEANIYGLSKNLFFGLVTGEIIEAILTSKLAMRIIAKKALVRLTVTFIPYVGWTFGGIMAGLAIQENYPLYEACNTDPLSKIEGRSPAYYCGRLGANLSLAAVGLTLDAVVGKLNKLGSLTKKGLSGKSKLFSKLKSSSKADDVNWENLKKSLIGDNSYNTKSVRDNLFKRIDDLSDFDIETLAYKPHITERLMQEPIYQVTFDGFVNSGSMYGKVKYRVDPYYSSQFSKYSDPYQFSFQKMINDGISKPGFYSINELDNAINIYNKMGSNREIIFVIKTDGTTILTPRYTDVEFPHPVLAGGGDVVSAGTIKPLQGNKIEISRQTGHYKIHLDDLDLMKKDLANHGYSVDINKDF